MNVLESNLCKQHGIIGCLTPSQLDWSNDVEFEAKHVSFSPRDNQSISLGLIDKTLLNNGQGVVSLGSYGSEHSLESEGNRGAFLFGIILKIPNNGHIYRLPQQISHLRPAIEKAAEDHQAVARNSDSYYCGIMYRSLPIQERQIAENWHVHKPFSRASVPPARIQNLEIPAETVDAFDNVAPDMVANEYLVSDHLGSCFQTVPTQSPLKLIESSGDFTAKDFPDSCQRVLEDREFVRGNSYVFHRAASVPLAKIGMRRSLLVISFMPSTSTRLALNL